MTDAPLASLAATTLRDPDAGGRAVLARNWTWDALWSALVAVSAVSTILGNLTIRAAGGGGLAAPILDAPLLAAAIEGALIWFTAFSLWRVGRSFGGTGDARGAMALVVWLQVLMTGLQAAQLLVLPVPLLARLVWIVGFALGLYWFVRFAMVLHGFARPFAVAGISLLVALSVVTAAALVLNLLGLVPVPAGTGA